MSEQNIIGKDRAILENSKETNLIFSERPSFYLAQRNIHPFQTVESTTVLPQTTNMLRPRTRQT